MVQVPRERVNWTTPRDTVSLPDIPRGTLPSTGRLQEDLAGIPRETHPDSWVPILPFAVQIRAAAGFEALDFALGLGTVSVDAAGGVAATDIGIDLGVITMGATAQQFALDIETEDDRQLGEQTIPAAAKIEPLDLTLVMPTITFPAAAKLEPTAFEIGLGERTLTAAGKLEPFGTMGLDLGQRSLSLAAKIEGISFIVDMGTRDVAAAAALGPVATPVGKRSYIETFNRTNSATLDANWAVSHNSGCRVTSNAAQARTASSNTGRQGGWNAYQGAEFSDSGRLYTDSHRIKAQLKASATSGAADNCTVIGFSHDTWNQTGINKVYLQVATGTLSGGVACAITTHSGTMNAAGVCSGQAGHTIRASTGTVIAVTDLIEFERLFSGSASVFNAYKNGSGTPFLTWDDSGNLVPSGATFRKPICAIECNYPIFQQQFSAPGIDQLEFWDV